MEFIEAEKFRELVQMLAPGSILLRTCSLQGGISAEMTAFEIQQPDGQTSKMILRRPGELTLRRNRHAAEDEFKILQLTKSLGLATQAPHFLDLSRSIFPTPYLVIEYIEGQPEFPSKPRPDFMLQLAEHLARIHSADYSNHDVTFLSQQSHLCKEISHNSRNDIHPSFAREHIREKLESITPFAPRNALALLHGDYWPGNILWRDKTLVAVVDWEDAKLGDPLVDFAISRLDILWIFGEAAYKAFTDHYQSLMDIDYMTLPYWDLCAALRLARLIGLDLAAWTAFFIPLGRTDITENTLREHFDFFVTQALEKL